MNTEKYTNYPRIAPTKSEKSIIDYVLVERNARCSIVDVRVSRAPEIFSDHHMVIVKPKEKSDCKKGRENEIPVRSHELIRIYKLQNTEIAMIYESTLKKMGF